MWLDYLLARGHQDLYVITSPEQLLPEFHSKHQPEWNMGAGVVFLAGEQLCNEPKSVPIVPLVIK